MNPFTDSFLPTDSEISSFVSQCRAAAELPNAESHDILNSIAEWLFSTRDQIRTIRKSLEAIVADGELKFGGSFHGFRRDVDVRSLPGQAWEVAVVLVERLYIQPKHLSVPSAEGFVQEALDISADRFHRHDVDEDFLSKFDPVKIREHFAIVFGDVREAAVKQLCDRGLDFIGRYRKPEERLRSHCGLHEVSYSGSMMHLTYHSQRVEAFDSFVRFIIHLATGEEPGSIAAPPFHGYNDGAKEWERKELFKKIKNPFPGVSNLRFTADNYVEMELERAVFSKVQVLWAERFKDEG